uniref:Retrotransposon gag domain-containing protein n=1 Tax=Fagus sylvatica TaxID=28930 RepID=A0A2N9H5H8_FAGSY
MNSDHLSSMLPPPTPLNSDHLSSMPPPPAPFIFDHLSSMLSPLAPLISDHLSSLLPPPPPPLPSIENSKGRLETSEAFFGSLFDTPTSSPTSSIMAEERVVQPEAPRMTMGLKNKNPYVHVRAFEEVIGSFYAQNVIETTKLRFFPFSLKDKAKGWLYTLKPRLVSYFYEGFQPRDRQFVQVACGGGFLQKEPEDAMDYLDEIAENSNTWNGPSPLDSTDRNRSSTTTSSGSVFRLREEDNMSAKISLLTKEIEALKLKGSKCCLQKGSYGGMPDLPRDRPHHKYMQVFISVPKCARRTTRLTEALSRTERGKLPSQTQPNPNNQTAKVVNTEKFEEVKSVTILRSGKEIGKSAPKTNEKSKETPVEKDESGIVKSNDIEKCPFLAPFSQALKLPKNLDVTSEILEQLHQVKLAECSVRKPRGVVEDVLVKVENFYYPVDFIILDIKPTLHPSANIPIILGRPFLATANALINCRNGRMKITFGSMTAELNIFKCEPTTVGG